MKKKMTVLSEGISFTLIHTQNVKVGIDTIQPGSALDVIETTKDVSIKASLLNILKFLTLPSEFLKQSKNSICLLSN